MNVLYCPFCAYRGSLRDFRVRIKKGYSRKMVRCPDCGEGMKKRTLLRELSLEDWARWLYTSIRVFKDDRTGADFYSRISWGKLLKRLSDYGFASIYWEAWKELKERFHETSGDEIDEILVKGYNMTPKEETLHKWLKGGDIYEP